MKNNKTAIAYVRASTNEDKQSNSLNIQREVINNFATTNGYDVVREFSEYCSGTDDSRVEFNKAVEYARETGCTLIIYRLDRCARTLTAFSIIDDILPQMRIVNMGDVEPNLMIIGVMLTIAAQESINTSVRLRATIKHLLEKDPSRTWGNQNLFAEHGAKAIEVRQANAMAYNTRIKGIVADLSLAGYTTVTAQFQRLNELGIKTRTNKPFTYHNLHRLMRS
tara:strand:- start:233 stop:901 length:669 start_codon:yes stop_codon:yes gene_type:complete